MKVSRTIDGRLILDGILQNHHRSQVIIREARGKYMWSSRPPTPSEDNTLLAKVYRFFPVRHNNTQLCIK
jgi:hypothetical protein